MQLPELHMSFADRARLSVEITQSLRCGRAFLTETSTLPVLSDCVLVLIHPEHGGELRLPAQIVMANEHGTGLSLTTLNAQHLLELDGFVESLPPMAAANQNALSDAEVAPAACTSSAPVALRTSWPASAARTGAPVALAEQAASAAAVADSPASEAPAGMPLLAAEERSGDAQAEAAIGDEATDSLDDSGESLDFPRADEEELEYATSDGSSVTGTEPSSANVSGFWKRSRFVPSLRTSRLPSRHRPQPSPSIGT